MNTSLDIKKLFELIDMYKYASIEGEKVELIVSPLGKDNDSERIITIGLQGGYSRESDSFIVSDGKMFDEKVLPYIISHFTEDDSLTNWEVIKSDLDDVTLKGSNETESGNIIYVETFNPELYDNLSKKCDELIDEGISSKKESSPIEKMWNELLVYVKARRSSRDFYLANDFNKEELGAIYSFISKVVEKEKSFSTSSSKKYKFKNEEILDEILHDANKCDSYGLKPELAEKILKAGIVKNVASLASSEKRVRKRLDFSDKKIQQKLLFSINELNKIGYFELKNSERHDVIANLRDSYPVESVYYSICDELLSYLDIKNSKTKAVSHFPADVSNVKFNIYDDTVVNSYEKLNEIIELVQNAKLDEEKFEIVLENDSKRPSRRRVTIGLRNGVSRSDTFKFLFTDGVEFDKYFATILNEIREKYPNFITIVNNDENVSNNYSLHTLKEDNEVLVKDSKNLDLVYRRNKPSIVQKFISVRDELASNEKKDKKEKKASNGLVEEFMRIKDQLNHQDRELLEKLSIIERQLNDEARMQDEKNIDTTVDFDKLHEYVKMYKIDSSENLVICNREDNSVCNDLSEDEKRNIEFAFYWSGMAGLNESKDDLFFGEKDAFSENNKKLFDLMSVQFKESIKRGINVDFDSLREQFANSGVPYSEKIFDRLFGDEHYVDYVYLYFKKSLGLEEDLSNEKFYDLNVDSRELIKIDAEKQARELIQKEEIEKIMILAQQYAKDIEDQNEQIDLRKGALELARKIYEESELELLKNEAKDFAMRILMSSDDKVNNVVDNLVNKIEEIYKSVVVIDGAKDQARILNEENVKEKLKYDAEELAQIIHKNNIRIDAEELAQKLNENNIKIDAEELAQIIHKNNIKIDAEELARKLNESNVIENLKLEALELARIIHGNNIKVDAEELARKLVEEGFKNELKQDALELAKIIHESNIKLDAEELARILIEKNTEEELKQGAEELAQIIHLNNIRIDAEELARNIMEESIKEELKRDAEELAKNIHLNNIRIDADEQARMLVDNEKENMFEIVSSNDEEELSPELKEISDAIDVVDSYAYQGQPSIKIFFDKKDDNIAEVLISSIDGIDEEVVYRKKFDINKLSNEVIPLLSKLYSRDNKVPYNKLFRGLFETPNTTKAGLVLMGNQDSVFQVSNAERKFIDFCEVILKNDFKNNEIEKPIMIK